MLSYRRIFYLIALFIVFKHPLIAQEEERRLAVKRLEGKIKVDGELTEAFWETAPVSQPFWEQFPYDTSYSSTISEIRMAYDDQFLYFGVRCLDPVPGGYVTTSLRRDFRGKENDVITVVLDPFEDKTNATFFGINPFGVRREGLISGISGSGSGGTSQVRSGFDLSWDNKWYGEAKIHDGYWTAEMAIPFKTLRYKEGAKTWFANFYRLDSKTATSSSWGHIPRNQSIVSPAFGGYLDFEEPLKKPGSNISIIPYVAGNTGRNFIDGEPTTYGFDLGGDAKIGITPSLNLDLTINPDFSQVEVDDQQTNITRFELSFPEKRQFFLENADLFASFGTDNIRPFFSRRIGIALDRNTGINVPVPITYGARLSGRIDKNWRIGVMNLQTKKDNSINLPGYNYSVMALQRQVFSRSNISAIFINKQSTHQFSQDSTLEWGIDKSNYNRTLGLDYNLASADNKWTGKFFYHHNIYENEESKKDFAHGATLAYNIPWLTLTWDHQIVGKYYDPEVGFVPRNNYKRVAPSVKFTFYSDKIIANHGPGVSTEYIWNDQDGKTDHNYALNYNIVFKTNAEFTGAIQNQYTYLFEDFDPTRSGNGEPLPMGESYNYSNLLLIYESDKRKKIFYELEGQGGGFFNGSLYRMAGNVNYRFQPYGIATLNFSYNDINLPEPYSSGKIFLFGPRFDITFSRKVFLTTYFQYNNQIDNVNINARLQYRYKPVSDFFLVYTENYFPDTFASKNRALVAKFTYWLNL
ncbi:DUF5916 domain-containing protein [Flexithrix dorotheae]|uniref:DUF5916 domain-containing protein n=1 Tax=Flexithrix dorotheae TaxID=70993 RepID=UPI00035F83F0|nr:DUF5916 domain-containing protein [Flexithrix dorotheae]